jgi:hypothetical protein
MLDRFNENDLELHISILGWVHIISGAFFLIIALFSFVVLPTLGVISGDSDGVVVLGFIGTGLGLLMAVLGLPGVIAGYGLLRRKPWARMLALVLGLLNLVNFPFGTAIAVYTLLVLMQNSANGYFENHRTA